jgi:nucleoid-associated protein YgaU
MLSIIKLLLLIIIFFGKITMTNSAYNKNYKSTSFEAKKKSSKQYSYKEQIASALSEKLIYFVIGLGVLLAVLTGISYFVLKHTVLKTTPVAKATPERTVTLVVSTPTPNYTQPLGKPVVDKKKAAEAAAAKPGTGAVAYVVKRGDTLWKIAEQKYNSGFSYKDLVAFNKIKNPSSIEPGQTILLPPDASKLVSAADGGVGGPVYAGNETTSDDNTTVQTSSSITTHDNTYTVVKGDTLWTIAQRTYGSGFDWKQISTANKVSDPTKLEPGTVLKLP